MLSSFLLFPSETIFSISLPYGVGKYKYYRRIEYCKSLLFFHLCTARRENYYKKSARNHICPQR
ncbi:hypothetical protein GCWU000341_02837 [Oribacterium sp. oral taxon 078 str. F0262]|nr:hypothetical protein GCWU000341_02837 [Oribacterium sp. oral taxon 078 str. F0262]